MDYIRTEENGQLAFAQSEEFLLIPSCLYGFHSEKTTVHKARSGRNVFCFEGSLGREEKAPVCSCCRKKMHITDHPAITLRHLGFGGSLTAVKVTRDRYACPECGNTWSQFVPFKAGGHMITVELEQYIAELLSTETYTNKQVACLAGVGQDVVKDIHKKLLLDKYTVGGKKLKEPKAQSRYLAIDEFKLHDSRQFATHIIDLETGHVLWIAKGKKKQVVYDFISHVGMDWMQGVVAVACDMNSDFQEAFEEKCPHIQIVFDHFHIIQNFNKKVISEVRRDEQARLREEGNVEAAKQLKGSRYILTSKRSTLRHKDEQAAEGNPIRRGNELFKTPDVMMKSGHEVRYDELLAQNRLLFTCDLIKEKLDFAYTCTDPDRMGSEIAEIVWICLRENGDNKHLAWFGRLLMNHHKGIVGITKHRISTGKMEGFNNKIKTIRRQGYGYPDDEYFFLKIINASRHPYERNPKSHRFSD